VARAAVRSGTRTDFVLLAICAAVSLLLNIPSPWREPVSGGFRRTVLAPFIALQKRAELTRAAFEAHETVTLHSDSVAARALAANSLQSENDRLRRILGLAGRLEYGFVPAEALHDARNSDEFTLALTAGGNAGVRQFSPVVAPEGLVGMISTVDPQTSLAITWQHPDFRVSAKTVDGTVYGIVAAHLGSGVDRYLLELRGVAFRNTLKPGTLVVSSGVGGVYPVGIPVGTVVRELKTAEGWARTYLMQPAVQPSDVGAVMILQPERARGGIVNAWAHITNADSASRRIAAAGDSLVRDSVAIFQRAADSSARVLAATKAREAAAAAASGVATDTAGRSVSTPTVPPSRPATATPRPAVVPPVRRDSGARAATGATPAAPRTTPRPPAVTTPRDTTRRTP